MPLKPADIDAGFRLILGRKPSEADLAALAQQCDTEAALRTILLSSEEFYRKFRTLRLDFEAKQTPILVHMAIPGTAEPELLDALADAPQLQPAMRVDAAGFDELCALPRPRRLEIRYVQGDLSIDAAGALDLPVWQLCLIRRPAARIYALYRAACAAEGVADMDFGTFLTLSLDDMPLRLELDNGQVRRFAGMTSAKGLGRESTLLTRALHGALASDMILGLAEDPGALLRRLSDSLDADLPDMAAGMAERQVTDEDLDAAIDALSPEARQVLDAYTGWDDYLYAVCEALLFPNSSARET